MKNKIKLLRGFTLIELLVVVGILALLLAITLIAINPAKQLSDATKTKRKSEATQILNAISQYQADKDGVVPGGIVATATEIGHGTGTVDICSALVPVYIAALPVDGGTGTPIGSPCPSTDYATGYMVSVGTSNRVTVANKVDSTISVTR